ncbi:unnamed protein product [Phytophthora fragariaefolia]|uniref:Unnamed protein product n=1 Tax=Phytophthora fragariaefolia TaxID=1490495 RepID=A0A9W6XNL5_9STRA|nr:unnamed protein product [Phytophthora fragariaefolia]
MGDSWSPTTDSHSFGQSSHPDDRPESTRGSGGHHPETLYVGRHAWPNTETVSAISKCIRNFVWVGSFTESGAAATPRIGADVANLPRRYGGLAVPDLKTELLAMAAPAVSNWAVSGSVLDLLIGDIQHYGNNMYNDQSVYITPGHEGREHGEFQRGRTLWTTGADMIRAAGAAPPHPTVRETMKELYLLVAEALPKGAEWGRKFYTGRPPTRWD